MKLKGFVFSIVSAVFFGSAGIFIKRGYSQNLNPIQLLTLQYLLAVPMLFFICIIRHPKSLKLPAKIIKKLLVLGTIGNTLMTLSLYSAMAYLDVPVATMLLYTYPAMVAIFSFFYLKEKISFPKIAAVSGTFLGCLLVLNIWAQESVKSISYVGVAFGILSAVSYAFMNIYSNTIIADDIPSLVITFYSTLFSLLMLMIINFDFLLKIRCISGETIINASLLAFFCEIIPLTLLYASIKYIGPVKASIISTLELPVSAFTAFFVLGEELVKIQYLGIFIILISIMILRLETSKEKLRKYKNKR